MYGKIVMGIIVFMALVVKAFSQVNDMPYYVITNQLGIREKPDMKASLTGKLFLGDSVILVDYSEKEVTASVDGVLLKTRWAKISYRGKQGWVFGGGICALGVTTYPAFRKKRTESEMLGIENENFDKIDKLVKDSVLQFKGTYIKVKAKNGREVRVRQGICYGELSEFRPGADGYILEMVRINRQHPDILEFLFNQTAYDITLYVNLSKGTKFKFPVDCMETAVSPSGKYVSGIDLLSQAVLLADFDTKKIIGKMIVMNPQKETGTLKWLNEKEIELLVTNLETNVTLRKVILAPQMQLKK